MLFLAQHAQQTFVTSSVLTAATFFAIGLIRGRIVDRQPVAAGLETLLIGGAAALVAFTVGMFLQGLAA